MFYPSVGVPDLVKDFGTGPVSKLILVLHSLNFDGWCIWAYV